VKPRNDLLFGEERIKPRWAEDMKARPPRGTLRDPWKSRGLTEGLLGRSLARGGRARLDRPPLSDLPPQGQSGPLSRRIPVSSPLIDRSCPVTTARPIWWCLVRSVHNYLAIPGLDHFDEVPATCTYGPVMSRWPGAGGRRGRAARGRLRSP